MRAPTRELVLPNMAYSTYGTARMKKTYFAHSLASGFEDFEIKSPARVRIYIYALWWKK